MSVKPLNAGALETQSNASAAEMALGQLTKVLGDSGTKRFSGYFFEEYLSDWRDWKRIDLVEEMRRGDASCRAALRAVKSPILATDWNVVTEDTGPRAEEIRLFVEQNLFGMRRSWLSHLREALAYLDFGHYVFEEIWEVRDGKVYLADLEPRIPHSILKWRLSNNAFGIVQLLQTDEAGVHSTEIPANKLLILTNDKEGDDVTGQSILRSAYKHFVYRDLLYKIQGISAERFGVGIPVVKMGPAAGDQDKADAEALAGNIRSNEKGYIVLPNNEWEVEILTPTGNPHGQSITEAIEHHAKQGLLAVLANFLLLGGHSGGGSQALSVDLSSFFLQGVEDVTNYYSEQFDLQVIKRLVDINFGPQKSYPHLTHAPVGDIDTGTLSTTLATLCQAGLIGPDWRTKQYVRQVFNLPEMDDDQLELEKERELDADIASLEEAPEPDEATVDPNAKTDPAKNQDA